MTVQELYDLGKDKLKRSGNPDYKADLMYIFNQCVNMDRQDIILNKNIEISRDIEKKFLSMINLRVSGIPLQYVIGHWYFMDIKFSVGNGVLIPRDDTEVLVRKCEDYLRQVDRPYIIDLCSGSGTIAIYLSKKVVNSEVEAIELSKEAFKYLCKNVIDNNSNVKAYNEDIFEYCNYVKNNTVDLIVSNPPYIPTNDMNELQKEVLMEPSMALDGGPDGLYFYREICKKWISKLKNGGMLAVEIGINQYNSVIEIFERCGLKDIGLEKDINGIERIVYGIKI